MSIYHGYFFEPVSEDYCGWCGTKGGHTSEHLARIAALEAQNMPELEYVDLDAPEPMCPMHSVYYPCGACLEAEAKLRQEQVA